MDPDVDVDPEGTPVTSNVEPEEVSADMDQGQEASDVQPMLRAFVRENKNKNTIRQTESSYRRFLKWLSIKKNESKSPAGMNHTVLDSYIGEFIYDLKKKKWQRV